MSRARDLADLGSSADAGGLTGRNLIINGAMSVAQRSTSVASLGTANGYNTVDRWQMFVGGTASAGRFTQSQASVTDLAGFPKSLKHEVTTDDTSIAAGEALQIAQLIEGQNLQALKKGYSDAEQFTVSFYVKGTAKTYVVEMYDADNTRHVAKTFSVTSSWSRVELTFPADTTGKFDNDNAVSLYLIVWLHCGNDFTSGTLPATWASVTNANRAAGCESLYSAIGNTFEITGVQLEAGQKATPFEHENYGTTLGKCQRYYNRLGFLRHQFFSSSVNSANPDLVHSVTFTPMRDPPTANPYTDAAYSSSGSTTSTSTTLTLASITITSLTATMQHSGTGTSAVKAQYYLELVSEL